MSSPTTKKTDDRFEQTSLSAERIDREAGIIYGVRVMKVESDNGYGYSLAAQRSIVGRYEQMPVGVSHDYDGKPMTVTAAWGTLFNPRMDALGTVADLRYLQSDQLTPKIIEDAQWQIDNPDKPGIFSLSAVTRIRREQGNVVEDFIPVRVDVVVRGATTKRFFEQSNQGDSSMEPEEKPEVIQPKTAEEHTAAALHSALDAVLADDSAGKDKAKKLARIIKALHDDEEEEEAETVETNTTEAAEEGVTEEKPATEQEEKPELTEAEIKAKEDAARKEREEKQEQAHTALQGRFEQLLVKFTALEKRVAVKEAVMPSQQRMEQEISATTAGIDLKTYWNDPK